MYMMILPVGPVVSLRQIDLELYFLKVHQVQGRHLAHGLLLIKR
uniref:Uncharacterized protein n=1 Tax=Rhizophora mucronata TaxID=61149 RepID=A0A2P2KK57_RHIMU